MALKELKNKVLGLLPGIDTGIDLPGYIKIYSNQPEEENLDMR